jgi:copper transport protein
MLTRAMAGHADASTAPWFTVGVQWAHLVSVGAWVGGLAWFLVALRRGDRGRGPGLARRFSTVAGATLGVVAVTGTLRALAEVGAWNRLVRTSFGETLLVKLGLFATLVALGALSRFRHVRTSGGGPAGRLRRIVRAEVAMGAAVLGATAVLAGLPPPASLAAASRPAVSPGITVSGNDYGTSVRVRLNVSPGVPGPNRFDATVTDYDSGKPLPAQDVSLRFQLDDRQDVAAATVALRHEPDSHWRGSASALSIEGRWTVTAAVQSADETVEVPVEPLTIGRPRPSG